MLAPLSGLMRKNEGDKPWTDGFDLAGRGRSVAVRAIGVRLVEVNTASASHRFWTEAVQSAAMSANCRMNSRAKRRGRGAHDRAGARGSFRDPRRRAMRLHWHRFVFGRLQLLTPRTCAANARVRSPVLASPGGHQGVYCGAEVAVRLSCEDLSLCVRELKLDGTARNIVWATWDGPADR
jgi:hypothetical protein